LAKNEVGVLNESSNLAASLRVTKFLIKNGYTFGHILLSCLSLT
jgi:hypothetical protein